MLIKYERMNGSFKYVTSLLDYNLRHNTHTRLWVIHEIKVTFVIWRYKKSLSRRQCLKYKLVFIETDNPLPIFVSIIICELFNVCSCTDHYPYFFFMWSQKKDHPFWLWQQHVRQNKENSTSSVQYTCVPTIPESVFQNVTFKFGSVVSISTLLRNQSIVQTSLHNTRNATFPQYMITQESIFHIQSGWDIPTEPTV